MSELTERLRNMCPRAPQYPSEKTIDDAADRIEHLERVLARAMESLIAVDMLFGPLAKDCTQKNWIDNSSIAIAAIDEALRS